MISDPCGAFSQFTHQHEYRTITMYDALLHLPEVVIAREMGIQMIVDEGWDTLYEYSYRVKGMFTADEYDEYQKRCFVDRLEGH